MPETFTCSYVITAQDDIFLKTFIRLDGKRCSQPFQSPLRSIVAHPSPASRPYYLHNKSDVIFNHSITALKIAVPKKSITLYRKCITCPRLVEKMYNVSTPCTENVNVSTSCTENVNVSTPCTENVNVSTSCTENV